MKRVIWMLSLAMAMGPMARVHAAPLPVETPAVEALQKDDLFAGTDEFAKGAKSVTEVNLDKRLLTMMGSFLGAASSSSGDDQKAIDLARKMEFVYVRSYEYEKPGQYQAASLEAFRKRLEGPEWSHMVKEHSATEQNDVWVRSDDNGAFSELVVISAEQNELSFVHLKGHMTMQELTQAGAKYGVPQASTRTSEPKQKGAK